jgi:hypothetical protein
VDETRLAVPEEAGEMGGEGGSEIRVACAEDQGDRRVEGRESSFRDLGVLLIQRREQASGPGADCW